jgi:hypothetical protein
MIIVNDAEQIIENEPDVPRQHHRAQLGVVRGGSGWRLRFHQQTRLAQ